MQNQPVEKEIGLEDVYQYEMYLYFETCFEWLYCTMQNQLIVKGIGLSVMHP